MAPKTRYAQCGDLNLAYQVVGDGDVDIILVPSFVSHIEFYWAHPAIKAFLDRVASFARLAIFDKAGTGLSDPVSDIPTLEQRAAEVEAVMDAAGMERPAVFGMSEGGPSAIFFSVTRPGRASALVSGRRVGWRRARGTARSDRDRQPTVGAASVGPGGGSSGPPRPGRAARRDAARSALPAVRQVEP